MPEKGLPFTESNLLEITWVSQGIAAALRPEPTHLFNPSRRHSTMTILSKARYLECPLWVKNGSQWRPPEFLLSG